MRVIAGQYRGRRLRTPPGEDTRPTADRVREALFSILGDRVGDARVLDLFAGSGALAIEALSRGAASAVLVERDPRAVDAIRANLDAIRAPHARVERADALAWLRRAGAASEGRFDLVFLDPPYSSARHVAGKLSQALPEVLSEDALIVSESDKRDPLTLDFPLEDERTYGTTRIAIHRVFD
jgi:16S rRNA (guanine966-N2)-methyltransferase